MEGKKLVRAAALTLNELLNKPELKERKQKLVIQKLKKKLKIYESYSNVLNTIISKPSNEAQQVLIKLRKNHRKRAGPKIAEWKTFVIKERKQKLVIQKLKKKLKIYESYSNVLNTIISKPSNEAQQVLIKLRKNHRKRAGLKIAEWKTFVSWIIRNVKQKIDYIEKCRKRKAIRIYFDKIPSIKNVLRISGMKEVEKYFNNLYSAKEADISDLEKWLNENVSERTLEFNATQIKEDINQAIAETPPFKATGPDLIHGRFWKSLLSARKWISEAVFLIIEGKIKLGKKEQEGRTFLAFKGGEVTPSNFRPITCLNITFKIITSVLNKHVIRCIEGTGLMPEEFKITQWINA
uniref:Reverse transcriptase domain-containing protein n=1 Tax=Parastrongyloides trichosuri TaxID=131310 RepID=A0A0N4Z8L4_PARTI